MGLGPSIFSGARGNPNLSHSATNNSWLHLHVTEFGAPLQGNRQGSEILSPLLSDGCTILWRLQQQ